MNKLIKKIAIFFPIFLLFYGYNSFGLHSIELFNNPFGTIESEQWLQESPIQYFIGFVINLIINNIHITYWIVVGLGFVYVVFAINNLNKKYIVNVDFFKVLYFTPFYLILFTWMGKPDPFTIGSIFLIISYYGNPLIYTFLNLILIFSHPQIAVIYFLLLFFLKLIDFKVINLIITIFSFITYILYLKNLNDFEGRSEWLLNNIDSIVETFLTNTLSGFVTLFLWLWIPIFQSNLYKDKRFLISLLSIIAVSVCIVDHTRIFVILSAPLIVYMLKNQNFINKFNNIFSDNRMLVLGLFQLQKRQTGIITDGWTFFNLDFIQLTIGKLYSIISMYISLN